MQRIDEILKIISDRGLNISEIERNTGIPKTRIYKWLDKKGYPKAADAETLIKWGKDLEEFPRGKKEKKEQALVVDILLERLASLTEQQTKVMAQQNSILERQANNVEAKIESIDSNLKSVLKNQDGGLGVIIELLHRDVHREANGSPEKERKILGDIARRIAPDLGSSWIKGNRAGDGKKSN